MSSGSSPKLEAPSSDPTLPGSVLGSTDWLGMGSLARWHLSSCLSSDLWWSWLLGLNSIQEWSLIWCSFSISSSKVAVTDRAFRWTSHTLSRLLSNEVSLFWWGLLIWDEWKSLWLGCIWAWGVSSFSHEGPGMVADTSSKIPQWPSLSFSLTGRKDGVRVWEPFGGTLASLPS